MHESNEIKDKSSIKLIQDSRLGTFNWQTNNYLVRHEGRVGLIV